MKKKEEASPLWLQGKDGKVQLYAADDVEAARINGAVEPTSVRSNGEPWNKAPELEGEGTQVDAIAEAQKANSERQEKITEQKDKEAQAQLKMQADPPAPKADFRVEVVEPEKPAKGGK